MRLEATFSIRDLFRQALKFMASRLAVPEHKSRAGWLEAHVANGEGEALSEAETV